MYGQYPLDTWTSFELKRDELRREADRACRPTGDRRAVGWMRALVSSLLVALGLAIPGGQRARVQGDAKPAQQEAPSPASYSTSVYKDLCDDWPLVHSGRVHGPFLGYGI